MTVCVDFGGDYFLPKQIPYVYTPQDGRKKDIALYLGGVGSGKTFSSVRKGFLITQLYPGSRGLVGALDYPLVRDTTWGGDGGWEQLLDEELQLRRGYHYDYNKTEHLLEFPNGSSVLFRGLRDKNRIKSLSLTWAHIEEASDVDLDSFLMLNSRLRQRPTAGCDDWWRYFLFMSTNPEESPGWINDLFIEQRDDPEWSENKKKAVAKIKAAMRCIHAPTSENTRLPEDYIDFMMGLADPNWIAVYVEGKVGGLGRGLAYKQFNRGVHINDAIAYYRPDLPLRLSVDFNVNPMTASVHQVLADDVAISIDEIKLDDSTTEALVMEFLRRYGRNGLKPHKGAVVVYGDAAGNSRSTKSTESDYAIIKRLLSGQFPYGVKYKVPDANPPVKTRVQAVNARLQNAKGQVNWYISSRCRELALDFERVKWDKDKADTGRMELDKSDPKRTHMSDNAGYFISKEFPFIERASIMDMKRLQKIQQTHRR